ncbi:hypothetical protein REC12_00275 [Desulfosporosinus sp. PR]|uniref:hypothetical protein n=1 Tax=Candidatus Desulfosporosinus nitrosoreducens TaxID=3401928 RepID=UPI0027F3FC2B|nr:hypothetical protein [Desulfosporosinus sp. PR]MDQ7092030.1 hypothetical protein [Desulfosporosinus sp. PR]
MSKLKLMYDVINTMKDKEAIKGILSLEGTKDQTKIFGFVNEFEKNLDSGETKLKISTELDYNGKKVKHDSQTEFTQQGCHGHGHHMQHMQHGFMGHMHHHRQVSLEGHEDLKCAGLKGKLTKLAYMLNILNQIKVEEQADQSVLVSLSLKEIPDDLKKVFQERMNHHAIPEHREHHGLMKEFFTLQEPEVQFKLWVREAKDVERILFTVEGKQKNDPQEIHDLKFKAELKLLN